jgi:hypothetical protein
MTTVIGRLDVPLAFKLFGDWTDRIAGGELPFAQPPRPQGIERNVVLTLWDWGRPTGYLHDEISTDRRTPTINPNGKLYGTTEESTDFIPILDPVHNTAVEVRHPVRDPNTPSSKDAPMGPSPYWGEEPIWDSQPQPDDGREGARLVHRAGPSAGESRFLQKGIGASVRKGVPARAG